MNDNENDNEEELMKKMDKLEKQMDATLAKITALDERLDAMDLGSIADEVRKMKVRIEDRQ